MASRDRVGRFLRTWLGLLLVATVLAMLFSPGHPMAFTALLVPTWVLATVAAAAIVFYGGDARLRESELYDPWAPASLATGLFAVLALVLKILLTLVADVLLGAAAVAYAEGVAISILALLAAYATVFGAGALGRLTGRSAVD